MYGLSCTDALRPSEGGHHPSTDSRVSGWSHACRLNPAALVRYVAPAFEFWRDRDDEEPEATNCDLAQYAVTTALASLPPGGLHDPLMVLECPQVLLVHYTDVGGGSAGSEGGRRDDDLGEALEERLVRAAAKYSSPPPRIHVRAGRLGGSVMAEFLVQDSVVEGGLNAFKKGVVEAVKAELS